MERHKCNLCSRTFANGRALGGHMKAHLATLPLPPKPEPESPSLSYDSESSSSEEEDEEQQQQQQVLSDDKALIYKLRENPKKSFRFSDPENGTFVVHDRESETESKNVTRKRSKRFRKSSLMGQKQISEPPKKPKISFMESPPISSVSDFSPEEDVAMCLMMLSRDTWKKNVIEEDQEKEVLKRVRGKHNECEKCGKKFRTSRALGSHKSICGEGSGDKIFECPFCYKVFGSGQALGGHKRSHLMASSSSNANKKESFIDLNLPAPVEEDDLSIVSDVSYA